MSKQDEPVFDEAAIDDEMANMPDPSLAPEEFDGGEEITSDDDAYIVVVIPEHELEDDKNAWSAHLPCVGLDGKVDWDNMLYIEGKYPNTAISRQALNAIPKKLRSDPLMAMKEADENLLRMCITRIGSRSVGWADLRHLGLDKLLHYKQRQMVSAYFGELTQPTVDEVDAFLTTVRSGRRKKRV